MLYLCKHPTLSPRSQPQKENGEEEELTTNFVEEKGLGGKDQDEQHMCTKYRWNVYPLPCLFGQGQE